MREMLAHASFQVGLVIRLDIVENKLEPLVVSVGRTLDEDSPRLG